MSDGRIYHTAARTGFWLSLGCAVHCMATPLLLIAFPFAGSAVWHDPLLEWSILVSIVVLGVVSLEHYRKKHHGSRLPQLVFASGVLIFLFAMVLHGPYHVSCSITASLIIAGSHVLNIALSRSASAKVSALNA